MKLRRITVLLLSVALAVSPAWGQFAPGQVLGAAALNAALAAPTITGGSINGAAIGQTSAKAVNATTLGLVGAHTGVISILPQSNAGTYNFNLPTTVGTAGYLLTSSGGISSPMTWTSPSSMSVATATTASSAAKWTAARSLAGNSVDGSIDVAFANRFVAGGTADAGLSGAQFLGALGNGLLKNTTTTGTLSIASAGSDYLAPPSGTALTSANSGGALNAYAGTSCTNQFIRSLSTAGAATCNTVGSSDLASSLSLTTPSLGVASATTINKVSITPPASSSTLTVADGKTLTASNTLTLTGTDGSSVAFGTGGTVLYSGGALGAVTASSLTFTPTTGGIVGTTTNDSVAAGKVGEYVESVVSTLTNAPGSATYGDLTSIALTAGDWNVAAYLVIASNGATVTNVTGGIGTASGTSATGLLRGDTLAEFPVPTAGYNTSGIVPMRRYSLSGPTTLYLKELATYTVATPQFAGRISARRVR